MLSNLCLHEVVEVCMFFVHILERAADRDSSALMDSPLLSYKPETLQRSTSEFILVATRSVEWKPLNHLLSVFSPCLQACFSVRAIYFYFPSKFLSSFDVDSVVSTASSNA